MEWGPKLQHIWTRIIKDFYYDKDELFKNKPQLLQ